MKYLLLLMVFISLKPAVGQQIIDEVLLDSKMKPVKKEKKAKYLVHKFQEEEILIRQRKLFSDKTVLQEDRFVLRDGKEMRHGMSFELDESSGDTLQQRYHHLDEPVGSWTVTDYKGRRVVNYEFELEHVHSRAYDPATTSEATADASKTRESVATSSPEFPGGLKKLYEFIEAEKSFPPVPESAGKGMIQIEVEWIVDESGFLTDITAEEQFHVALRKEAVRIVREMPRWNPMTVDGSPVKAAYKMAIRLFI
jgi:hypothetical protein